MCILLLLLHCGCTHRTHHRRRVPTTRSIDGPSIPASAARRRASPQAPARDGWRVGATTATRRPCRLTRDGQVSRCTRHEPQHARYAARAAPHLAPRGVGNPPRARLSQRPRTAPRQHFDISSVYVCETASARRQAEWVACARGGCRWWWACLMLVTWAMLDAHFCGRRALCTAMRAPERLRESPLAATVIAPHQL